MYRIINNKRIDLTEDEWTLYQNICRSYDRPNFKGSDLFAELFETNDKGVIQFLRPPTKFTSIEVFLFMMCVFMHQHVREMYSQTDDLCRQQKEKLELLDQKLAILDQIIAAKQVSSMSSS